MFVTFLIGLLTVILVLDCFFLILLVLIQLPKKEAGAGIAFGGGATDALFGPGSGTALTKITKYCAALFLGLSLVLSVMRAHVAGESGRRFQEELLKKEKATTPALVPGPGPTNTAPSTGALPSLLSAPDTNASAPAKPTNAAPANPPPAEPK